MKNLIILLSFVIGFVSCGSDKKSAAAENLEKDRVEVIYFHGKQRCPTCMAIEKNAKEVIDSVFPSEIKDGTVVLRIVDISTPEGEALADEYEVSWSSLFVNKWSGGVETRDDLTEFGFGNARNNPDEFKDGLVEKIRESLK